MQKTESVWHFGEFTAVNSWYRNASGTTEKTEIFRFGDSYNPKGIGTYHWINRPWQRYDYESSLGDAFNSLLCNITRSQYEAWKGDIDKIKEAIDTMENYGGSPK